MQLQVFFHVTRRYKVQELSVTILPTNAVFVNLFNIYEKFYLPDDRRYCIQTSFWFQHINLHAFFFFFLYLRISYLRLWGLQTTRKAAERKEFKCRMKETGCIFPRNEQGMNNFSHFDIFPNVTTKRINFISYFFFFYFLTRVLKAKCTVTNLRCSLFLDHFIVIYMFKISLVFIYAFCLLLCS
jgi:hypothetical protein